MSMLNKNSNPFLVPRRYCSHRICLSGSFCLCIITILYIFKKEQRKTLFSLLIKKIVIYMWSVFLFETKIRCDMHGHSIRSHIICNCIPLNAIVLQVKYQNGNHLTSLKETLSHSYYLILMHLMVNEFH